MNRRNAILVLVALGAAGGPLAAMAQRQGKIWRLGFLALRRIGPLDSDFYGGLPQGMRELGYVEGKNLVILWRSAEGKPERLPVLAAELLQSNVDIIVAGDTPATSAAQKATATIPIVMGSNADPVGTGFVKSLARPGGNITGISIVSGDMSRKQLEMLLGMLPKLSRVAFLLNPANKAHAINVKGLQAAAQDKGIKILSMEAPTLREIENAFSVMKQQKVEAVITPPDALFVQHYHQIAELAAQGSLPSMSSLREFAHAGGLMSYGPNLAENYRRAATYVDRILKGAKPGDLPVEQPAKFEFIINARAAMTLGIAIPRELLLRADEVIQ